MSKNKLKTYEIIFKIFLFDIRVGYEMITYFLQFIFIV